VLPDGYLGAHIDGGVLLRPFDYDKKCQFTFLGTNALTQEQEQKYEAYARSQIGEPYDLTAIFGDALHRDWRSTNGWFCSDLMQMCSEQAKCPWLRPEALDRTTPRDIYITPVLQPCDPPPFLKGVAASA